MSNRGGAVWKEEHYYVITENRCVDFKSATRRQTWVHNFIWSHRVSIDSHRCVCARARSMPCSPRCEKCPWKYGSLVVSVCIFFDGYGHVPHMRRTRTAPSPSGVRVACFVPRARHASCTLYVYYARTYTIHGARTILLRKMKTENRRWMNRGCPARWCRTRTRIFLIYPRVTHSKTPLVCECVWNIFVSSYNNRPMAGSQDEIKSTVKITTFVAFHICCSCLCVDARVSLCWLFPHHFDWYVNLYFLLSFRMLCTNEQTWCTSMKRNCLLGWFRYSTFMFHLRTVNQKWRDFGIGKRVHQSHTSVDFLHIYIWPVWKLLIEFEVGKSFESIGVLITSHRQSNLVIFICIRSICCSSLWSTTIIMI